MESVRMNWKAALYTADPLFARRIRRLLPGPAGVRLLPDGFSGDFSGISDPEPPDFLLIDLSDDPEGGLRLIGRTKARFGRLCFLERVDQPLARAAMEAGADGLLLKSDSDGRILERLTAPAHSGLRGVNGTHGETRIRDLPAIWVRNPPGTAFRLTIGFLLER